MMTLPVNPSTIPYHPNSLRQWINQALLAIGRYLRAPDPTPVDTGPRVSTRPEGVATLTNSDRANRAGPEANGNLDIGGVI